MLLKKQALGHVRLEELVPEQDLPEGSAHVRLAEERREQVLLVDPAAGKYWRS